MIKVEYVSSTSNSDKAVLRNIGFQMLMRRHHKRYPLRYVSKKIRYPLNEIDDLEMGKTNAKFDVLIALIHFYQLRIDEVSFENIKKSYELK